MGTPQTLATQLAEAQADLAAAIGAEQRATALAYNYRAESAAQESLQEQARLLNASIQQSHMARGYAKHADETAKRIKALALRIADAHFEAMENAAFLSRVMAGTAADNFLADDRRMTERNDMVADLVREREEDVREAA